HDAEALAAITGWPSRDDLEQHWRDVLLQHFHDILPGTSIARVSREAVETLTRVSDELDDYVADRLSELPRAGDSPAALNLSGVPRDEHVRVGDTWFRARAEPYAAAPLEPAVAHPELSSTDDTLGNGRLTLQFGATGEIVSCVDTAGAEHASDGLNRLVVHRDPRQRPWDAWDIGQGYLTRIPHVLRPSTVRTAIDGPTAVRTQVYTFGRSRIEQRVIVEAGSVLVRFETRVDWRETHRMLRADFRPAHYGETSISDIQFGHLGRPTTENDPVETAQFEICAHKWIATETSDGGFAVLNDSKYGHRAKAGLLSLNLLRSTTFPDKSPDRGIHEFSYAFRPYIPGDLTAVIRDGYRLNNPLHVLSGVSFPSFATTSDLGVIIETIKPAENGDGVVVRMYESLGRATVTSLRTTAAHTRATVTDLLERPQHPADLKRLKLGPFEILTIHLET
ncbi:MAG TPA: glycoside hydrolase family 38 C-terminal domain-containing protein, partial [Pseudolysinimonas sp.]|nr:glycoside hydrolase family 38 C-terminal domain-containing protein [Pseudolysinimonas sp.]